MVDVVVKSVKISVDVTDFVFVAAGKVLVFVVVTVVFQKYFNRSRQNLCPMGLFLSNDLRGWEISKHDLGWA